MRLLIIDNYDSFTFNLKHMCQPYVDSIDVIRNNELHIDNVIDYDKIIISPGPGLPSDAGSCLTLIKKYHKLKPILGVCLGAQAIAVAFGAQLFNLKQVMHGKCSTITILDKKASIYKNIPHKTQVGRYHSWAIDLFHDKNFIITAVDEENIIMSFQHKIYDIIADTYTHLKLPPSDIEEISVHSV